MPWQTLLGRYCRFFRPSNFFLNILKTTFGSFQVRLATRKILQTLIDGTFFFAKRFDLNLAFEKRGLKHYLLYFLRAV